MRRVLWQTALLVAVLPVGWGCQPPGVRGAASGVPSLPEVVRAAQVGEPVAEQAPLDLSIALPLRNDDELDKLLADLYDPQSPRFHHFLSPQDFAARFHPRAREVEKVRQKLLPYGIQVDAAAHGAFLGLHGTVAQFEDAFQVTLYHMTAEDGRTFVAPDQEPTLPGAVPLVAVHGLVSGLPPQALYPRPLVPALPPQRPVPGVVSRIRVDAGLDAHTLRKSYRVPAHLRGQGQVVGLFQLDHYDPNDLRLYAQQNDLPIPNVHTLYLDGATDAVQSKDIQAEVTLDIEMVMAMAPELAEIRLYQGVWAKGVLGRSYYFNVFNEMANPTLDDQKLVRSLSTSYGYSEGDLSAAERQSEHNLFRQMAAQGQTLFSAAGDTGAWDTKQRVAVVDPAIQPYVVAVGGTQLTPNGDGHFGDEAAWTGSGGGVSDSWALPSYQAGMVRNNRYAASQAFRNAPDVAFNADPNSGFLVTVYGSTYRMGGTSAAAPLWAGVLGLINAARAGHGLMPLGFFNPTLYRLANSGNYGALFNDTTVGDNGRYQAGRGYDNVTGWGTPKVGAVVRSMAHGWARRPVAAPDWAD